MPVSREVRRLDAKWQTGSGWPKRLDWIEIKGVRGWTGQRFELRFPIMAVVGENGVGKSTVLQAAASVYSIDLPAQKERFASDFFPDTPWDQVRNAEIKYAVREGGKPVEHSVRKPTDRWRGNPQRRKRAVEYIDLSRIQPVPARVGYTKLAKSASRETSADAFERSRLARFSAIMGRAYESAKMALSDADENRRVPVVGHHGATYSGFHQGAGETTVAELLQADLPKNALILIDEVESSLHPRAQRRLIRDLAERCREAELQIVLTTHSPYVLDELPAQARAYILETKDTREIIYGVSPEFALSKMDEVPVHECELYVEDPRAERMLVEILAAQAPGLVQRCKTIPYGAASVGQALGQMIVRNRFPRPSCVFLDGDKAAAPGCLLLPGEDAPERVVFEALHAKAWTGMETRIGRPYSNVADACNHAMTLTDHHEWIASAATPLVVPGDILWQAMCAEWATSCLDSEAALPIVEAIEDRLIGIEVAQPVLEPAMPKPANSAEPGVGSPTSDQAEAAEALAPDHEAIPLFHYGEGRA